ncbi:hypothetical protein MATL_G00069560 [Megalops atlanticus]|uniref:J domain-containing protein n=1 Tax=Megalops atlanticus TaxID=7932 RepID=A0A9D3Q9H6_MEGAT|nr:hypothetical protein MATL_G00069560 [Megalops atlanticus]
MVGNGVCHGLSRRSEPDSAHFLKQQEVGEGGDTPWASPDMRVETCGALGEDWQEEEEASPVGAEAEATLKEVLDTTSKKMAKESSFSPPSKPSVSMCSSVQGPGGSEGTEVWQPGPKAERGDDHVPESPCPDTPEEDGVLGMEEDEKVGSRNEEAPSPGQDRWEDVDGDEEDEGADEDAAGGNEEGRGSRTGGELGPRKPGGGRRGRGQQALISSSRASLSAGGRHKQTRRRNHHHHHGRSRTHAGSRLAATCQELLSESLWPWLLAGLHMVVELIVLVAHRCGEWVEAMGIAAYVWGSRILQKATDLPVMKAEALRLLSGARSRGASLAAWIMKAAERGWRASASCLCLICTAVLLGWAQATGLLGRLSGERGRRWWAALRDSRAWKGVAALWKKVLRRPSPSTPESPSGVGRGPPGQELERLLVLAQIPEDELDPFTVLGVEASATDTELKRAYRQLAVQVHPDKNKHPRAGEAFKVLRAAWDIVSNPETRREYELKRMAETELSRSMNEFLIKLQDDLKEAMNTMMCTKCEGKHKRFEMERDPSEARFCGECNKRHSAEEGDFWAESSMLGLRITYFAFIDGKVYDITEWAGCQRIGISPDTHRVPYHISFGSKSNSGATRHRTASDPPPGPASPADLQDFFNRIFQGAAPNGPAANGSFSPPGAPPHHPAGSSPGASGPFSARPPHAGFFTPSGQRAEPGEARTEGSKPPRRRKKIRKPFQR